MTSNILSPHVSVFQKAISASTKVVVHSRKALTGGFSGADVYRIVGNSSFPGTRFTRKTRQIVIKLSDHRLFEIEREKFESLPKSLRRYFVNFNGSKQQVDGWFFILMPYLNSFETLEKVLFFEKRKPSTEGLARLVFDSMTNLQFSARGKKSDFQSLVIHRLYLASIETSLLKSLEAWQKADVQKLIEKAYLSIKVFREASRKFEVCSPPFMTRMHGDCHSRNIMVNPRNMKMKFIDIDAFENDGDYVIDFGELIGDLNIYIPTRYCTETEKLVSIRPSSEALKFGNSLLRLLKNFAEKKHHDYNWENRLYLAQSRHLFNMLTTIDPSENEKLTFVLSKATEMLRKAFEA